PPKASAPGISPVVVISDGLWRGAFGADRAVLGKTLRIDNDPYTIIGVTEPAFRHTRVTLETKTEVWAPCGWIASPLPPPTHSARFLPAAIGLLKPGTGRDEARGRMDAFGGGLRQPYPTDYPTRMGWVPTVDALKQDLIASARSSLLIVMDAAGLVLLLAC